MGVQGGENIGQVGEFLTEADGAIKIEDILPLFPDFAHIDAFKDALRDGLQQYDAQIQSLRSEMDDATRIADALRYLCLLTPRTAVAGVAALKLHVDIGFPFPRDVCLSRTCWLRDNVGDC